MTTSNIKFRSTIGAWHYFRDLGFNPWDSHKLASALWTAKWGQNKINDQQAAVNELRTEFPELCLAAGHYKAGGHNLADQETVFSGTDIDHQSMAAD